VHTDERAEAGHRWSEEQLGPGLEMAPASADASFRRYFRLRRGGRRWILMDAPPEHEDCRPFVALARALRAIGLNVPEVLAADLERGFLLLTDLGDTPYLAALDPDNADALYGDALAALLRLQRARPPADLPPYDHALLAAELELFPTWFLGRHLGLTPPPEWPEASAVLIASALEQPRVWVHRDYHSRNLMVSEADNPGILDFQDAVLGPCTYDVVSLLRDCYIAWPEDRVHGWVERYRREAAHLGLLPEGLEAETFHRWFDRMGLQRHLKAIGIFARLHHRDGKPGYLGDIPRTLDYVLRACARDPAPALRALGAWLAEAVRPRLEAACAP